LILLLCGSATISALMGNIDDAVSITVAVLIVLTGIYENLYSTYSFLTSSKSVLFKKDDLRRVWKLLTSLYLITAMLYGKP
jgi:hypothetical protein